MKKVLSMLMAMMLMVNLVGCGNSEEPAKENKEEATKTEEVVKEEVVEKAEVVVEEELAMFSEMESVDELLSTFVSKLAEKGVILNEAEKTDDGYATTVTYYVEFEHDIDEWGDWNNDSDFYIDMVIDDETLEPYSIYADCMFTGLNQSAEMKAIAETIIELYGVNDDAIENFNELWNPYVDVEFTLDLGDGSDYDAYFSTYADPSEGVQDISFGIHQ